MNIHTEFKNENQLNQLNYPVNLLDNNSKLSHPIHIQNLEKALNLNSFLKQVHSLIDDKRDEKINSSISKQQSKEIKSSIYSFNKTGKNKNWLKNILIDNSDDESDDDIEQDVEQLLKIRKNYKKNNKINTNISSHLLSLTDSVPLNSLFKNEKMCKNSIKKKTSTNSKKKLKTECDPIKENTINTNAKLIETKEDDKYQLSNYFEPTLNSKSFNRHDNDLIDSDCLDSKLLDDIKYESALPDELLQGESNMNDFVNSYLPNMNDQIVYSNQLPDEIFETEEEISNGFHYDLNKLTSQEEIDKNKIIEPIIDTSFKPIDVCMNVAVQYEPKIESFEQKINGSTIIQIVNSTASIKNTITTNSLINSAIDPLNKPEKSLKPIESFEPDKLTTIKQVVKKKDKLTSKSLLETEPEQIQSKRRKLWSTIVKKEIPKAYKLRMINRKEMLNNCKRLAVCCSREKERNLMGLPKLNRECSKKSNKELATYRRNDGTTEIRHQLLTKIGDQVVINSPSIEKTIIKESNDIQLQHHLTCK